MKTTKDAETVSKTSLHRTSILTPERQAPDNGGVTEVPHMVRAAILVEHQVPVDPARTFLKDQGGLAGCRRASQGASCVGPTTTFELSQLLE